MRTVICPGTTKRRRSSPQRAAALGIPGSGAEFPWPARQRGEEVDDLRLGWAVWFQALDAGAPALPSQSVPIPTAEPPKGRRKVLAMAQSNAYAFRPADEVRSAIDTWAEEIGWDHDCRALGIHIRRGDSTYQARHSVREEVPLARYLAKADLLCRRYGIDTIYLSTESEEEIDAASPTSPLSVSHPAARPRCLP